MELHCVSEKKRHPFYICYSLVRCHPILPILGRNILKEIWNKRKCTGNHILFHMFVLYRVKSSNDFTAYSRPIALHTNCTHKSQIVTSENYKVTFLSSKQVFEVSSIRTQARSRPRQSEAHNGWVFTFTICTGNVKQFFLNSLMLKSAEKLGSSYIYMAKQSVNQSTVYFRHKSTAIHNKRYTMHGSADRSSSTFTLCY